MLFKSHNNIKCYLRREESLKFHNTPMVAKLTQMKTKYKPDSRRSKTAPIIFHSREFLVPWKWLSIWRRMAIRSRLNFCSSSKVGSRWGLHGGGLSEKFWRVLEGMMLEDTTVGFKKSRISQTVKKPGAHTKTVNIKNSLNSLLINTLTNRS